MPSDPHPIPSRPTRRERLFQRLNPGMLSGLTLRDWGRILHRNRYAVDLPYAPRALAVTAGSLLNSTLGAVERARFGRRVARAEVQPLLFVLGVWRSGTTHLHNLLAQDPRFAAPTFFQVRYPHIFLTAEPVLRLLNDPATTQTRVQDQVRLDWTTPGEDEHALAALSLCSPLFIHAFPRHRARYEPFYTFDDASPAALNAWKTAFLAFVRKLSFRYQRPLVLKSPNHLARIRHLLDVFPDARFVHIHRHPYDVYRSACHTLQVVHPHRRLQHAPPEGLNEIILHNQGRLYDAYFAGRPLLPDDRIYELSYQALIRDPAGELSRLYERLNLPAFSLAESAIQTYLHTLASYQPNAYPPLPADLRARLQTAFARPLEAWHYAP